MSQPHLSESSLKITDTAERPRRAILLTCYMTGADQGANLGSPGYSYDFVAQVFAPLLAQWGELIPVPHPQNNLEKKAQEALDRGLDPIHVSFLPFQDAVLSELIPNIVVPAWEFPDIPNDGFDDNPKNDWRLGGNKCASVIVGGGFTKRTFEAGGINVPIHVVPVPTPKEYFEIGKAQFESGVKEFDFDVYDPREKFSPDDSVDEIMDNSEKIIRPWWRELGRSLETVVRTATTSIIGSKRRKKLKNSIKKRWDSVVQARNYSQPSPGKFTLPFSTVRSIPGDSIVYTSIFNPNDGRKNWLDILSAFQYALADHDDAVLLVKLITSRPKQALRAFQFYLRKDIPANCKVYFITDFLSHEQMVSLAESSTYYLQATKGEGNCLPLMNFFAAGRPGISPCHTAIGDYFEDSMGFKVETHPEPCAWPQDPGLRFRTTWQRTVWPSLVEQISRSYHIAKNHREEYEKLSENCRQKMKSWSHESVVQNRLMEALQKTTKSLQTNLHEVLSMTEGQVAEAIGAEPIDNPETASSKKVA